MRRKWLFFVAPLALAVFVAIGGGVVLLLWNWLLPAVFGGPRITFWEALGLLALCRILFGSFGGRGFPRANFRRRMAERWERMTPEERDRFRQGMRSGCGFAAPGGTNEPASS